jgi:uncharacterized protein (DUF2236 family)
MAPTSASAPAPRSWRARLDAAIFTRVAGPDAFEKRDRIHRTPGPRWFPEDAVIRRVHDDAAMYPGGIRALLLQSLHPLAMAAVAQHSGYRSDVWGRLARTSTFLATTTFGTAADAHLLTWVHVAEVDSFLAASLAFARHRLTAEDRDRYVAETAVVARKLVAVDVPETEAELAAAVGRYRGELAATPEALDVAAFLLTEAPLPAAARPAYRLLAAAAVDLLPPWAAELLELPRRGPRARAVVHAGAAGLLAGMRWVSTASRPAGPIPVPG